MSQSKNLKEKSTSYKNKKESLSGREPLKTLYLRIPSSFCEDIKTIAELSGLSMNAACVDLLRPAIKTKLRQLREE